jgi:hypothetical protein
MFPGGFALFGLRAGGARGASPGDRPGARRALRCSRSWLRKRRPMSSTQARPDLTRDGEPGCDWLGDDHRLGHAIAGLASSDASAGRCPARKRGMVLGQA